MINMKRQKLPRRTFRFLLLTYTRFFENSVFRLWSVKTLVVGLLLAICTARIGYSQTLYKHSTITCHDYLGPDGCRLTMVMRIHGSIPDFTYQKEVKATIGETYGVRIYDFVVANGQITSQTGPQNIFDIQNFATPGYEVVWEGRDYSLPWWVNLTTSFTPPTGVYIGNPRDVCDGNAPQFYPETGYWDVYDGPIPPDENRTRLCDARTGCSNCSSKGMASYSLHLMLASLHIEDTPISYNCPVGPSPQITVVYNQREVNQPASFTYSNFGPKWTFNWLSYVTDNGPSGPAEAPTVYARGGGTESYSNYDPQTHSYAPEEQSLAVLVRTSDFSYEKQFPDGSKEVFTASDGSSSYPRKIFLTSVVDPQNNAVTLTYDSHFRITTLTDSLNQATSISYRSDTPTDLPNYYLIDHITDPFQRPAAFEYNGDGGQLSKIIDPMTIESEFVYQQGTNFITLMRTPYGETHFTTGQDGNSNRWIEVQDPELGRERVEYKDYVGAIPAGEPVKPRGFANLELDTRNTFYWDKKAIAQFPDYTKAHIFHWLTTADGGKVSGVKHSEKLPSENRVWYAYLGYTGGSIGGQALTTRVARVLDDGTTQESKFEYNEFGNRSKFTDPKNRVTRYEYAENGIDLSGVYQQTDAGEDKIAEYTYDPNDPPHLHHSIIDAARQVTSFTYDSHGQVRTMQTPTGTTTYTYSDGTIPGVPNGYLASVQSPEFNQQHAVTSFTYDDARHVETVTNTPDAYAVTTYYDSLDRPTQISYPDGSSQEFRYTEFTDDGMDTGKKLLDLTQSKDRQNRWTYRHYDGNRHMDWIKDPLLRKTSFDWCNCGSLMGIIDPNGNVTHFEHDLESRVISKTFAFNTPRAQTVLYGYENTTSRLKSMTDAMTQTTNYSYDIDNNLSHVTYTNAVNPTPNVSYIYDPYYNRVSSMTDGIGSTTYTYYPVTTAGTLGASKLKTVGGLFSNDTITYGYDQLGRRVSQSINGFPSYVHYDSLGRIDTSNNQLGNFTRMYDGVTPRLQQLAYPNGVRADYTYFVSNAQDRRLQTLRNSTSNGMTTLSQFGYAYASEGQIQTLTKSLSGIQTTLGFGNDDSKQLISVGTANQDFNYSYDNASNRYDVKAYTGIVLQTESYYTINHLNQLDTVSVNGADAVPLYYDNNGNLTDDAAGKTYEWDAANRLVAINYAATSSRTEFAYDGLGRRVKISEYGPGITATIQPTGTDYTPFTTEPFVLISGSYTLTFTGLDPATTGNTNTALLDAVKLNGTLVTNGGFETPTVQDYQVAPAGSSWSYSGRSGIAANGSTMTGGNAPAPEGNQVAFIQNDASLWQGAMVAGGTYTLSFNAAQRSGNETYQQLRINLRPALGPTSVKTFIWSGNTIAEERDAPGSTVTKRFFDEGEQRIGGSDAGNYYYTRDHLGSVREVSDATGTLKGQYDYDAWGNSVVVKGKMQVNFGFTGHYFHQPSGINLAIYRAYSPTFGRWISRDPLGERAGSNLYSYVGSNPISDRDPTGLLSEECIKALLEAAAAAGRVLDYWGGHYDRIDDTGPWPQRWGSGWTTPGSHYDELRRLQDVVREKIKDVYRKCDDDCDGGRKAQVADWIRAAAYAEVPEPLWGQLTSTILTHVPGSDATWGQVQTGLYITAAGAVVVGGGSLIPAVTPVILRAAPGF